ncbi:MAG: cytoplasmic protein, partial [Devosia nanyangense]|nr:cytoplasmic protein [Devosia nanyangense]
MALSTHDALIYLMIVSAWSDTTMSEEELERIEDQIVRLPVFAGFDTARLEEVANACVDLMNGAAGLDGVLDAA